MITIIKKNNKFYRQEIEEQEITLEELEKQLNDLKSQKQITISEEIKSFDDSITEKQSQINELKAFAK